MELTVPKEDAKTCWEYLECCLEIREKCPAYKSVKSCWYVAGQYCGRVSDRRGIEKCFGCEWYRHNHELAKGGNYSDGKIE